MGENSQNASECRIRDNNWQIYNQRSQTAKAAESIFSNTFTDYKI